MEEKKANRVVRQEHLNNQSEARLSQALFNHSKKTDRGVTSRRNTLCLRELSNPGNDEHRRFRNFEVEEGG